MYYVGTLIIIVMESIPQNKTDKKSKFEQRAVFFFVWMGVSALTFGFFALIDFLPENPTTEAVDTEIRDEVQEIQHETSPLDIEPDVDRAQFPKTIVFDSLGKEVSILNPNTNSVEVLDNALLSGVVRHPDSADFQNTGTIFLLGHSSYLPVVHNKNFQAFNGIQKLAWGDIIRVRSDDTEYVYSVDRVYEAKASDAMVPIQHEVEKLTLATCNSFGTKDDRYIVEASLVSKYTIEV